MASKHSPFVWNFNQSIRFYSPLLLCLLQFAFNLSKSVFLSHFCNLHCDAFSPHITRLVIFHENYIYGVCFIYTHKKYPKKVLWYRQTEIGKAFVNIQASDYFKWNLYSHFFRLFFRRFFQRLFVYLFAFLFTIVPMSLKNRNRKRFSLTWSRR